LFGVAFRRLSLLLLTQIHDPAPRWAGVSHETAPACFCARTLAAHVLQRLHEEGFSWPTPPLVHPPLLAIPPLRTLRDPLPLARDHLPRPQRVRQAGQTATQVAVRSALHHVPARPLASVLDLADVPVDLMASAQAMVVQAAAVARGSAGGHMAVAMAHMVLRLARRATPRQ
jgi:hypothetical protein